MYKEKYIKYKSKYLELRGGCKNCYEIYNHDKTFIYYYPDHQYQWYLDNGYIERSFLNSNKESQKAKDLRKDPNQTTLPNFGKPVK